MLYTFFLGLYYQANAIDIKSGIIWNNQDAQYKCPDVCISNGMAWNDNWRTVESGKTSVCGCYMDEVPYVSVEDRCIRLCTSKKMDWTGIYSITEYGLKCRCREELYSKDQSVDIYTGPIWSDADANHKCPRICKSKDILWDGNWRTVKRNEASVCGCF